MSIDFDREASTVELAPELDNCTPYCNNTIEEVHYLQVYLTKLENQANEAKINEMKSLTQQSVYTKEENLGQSCISLR